MRVLSGRSIVAVALAMLCALTARDALAQDWPNRPVRIIVPGAPGASTDVMGRIVAQALEKHFGVAFVVENRTGGSGLIGAEAVARATPDGYTLLFTQQDTQVLVPLLRKRMSYDVDKSFVPIAKFGDIFLLYATHAAFPAKTMKEFVAHARQNPGGVRFASGGIGGINHLFIELLRLRESLDLQHIPYRGGSPAVVGLLSGQVDLFGGSPTLLAPSIDSGKLRGLGIAKDTRSKQLPNVPTMGELGYSDFVVSAWFGLFGPAEMPQAVVRQLSEASLAFAQTAEFQQRLTGIGAEGTPLGSEAFGAFIDAEKAKWKAVIQNAKVQIDE